MSMIVEIGQRLFQASTANVLVRALASALGVLNDYALYKSTHSLTHSKLHTTIHASYEYTG